MLDFRKANVDDLDLLFDWANETLTRQNSYHKELIPYQSHIEWFNKFIEADDNHCYIFLDQKGVPVGQVRISESDINEAVISILVDSNHRGKGYSTEMIITASSDFLFKHVGYRLLAYIFITNQPSYHSFLKAGYQYLKEEIIKDIPSYILYKN